MLTSVSHKPAAGYDLRIYSFIKHSQAKSQSLERSVHDLPVAGGTVNVNNVLKDRKLTSGHR